MIPSSKVHRAETTDSSAAGSSMPPEDFGSESLGSRTPKSGPSTSDIEGGQEDTGAAENPELLPHRAHDSEDVEGKSGSVDDRFYDDGSDSPGMAGSSGRGNSQSKETAAAREIRKVMGHLKPGSKGRKTFGGGSPRPWQCQRCTVVHEGPDANQATCPVCGALRPRGALPFTKSPKGADKSKKTGSSSSSKGASDGDMTGADLPEVTDGNADDIEGSNDSGDNDDDDDDDDNFGLEQESDEEARPNGELSDGDGDNDANSTKSNIGDESGAGGGASDMDANDAVHLELPPTTKLGRKKGSFSSISAGGGDASNDDGNPSARFSGEDSASHASSMPLSSEAAAAAKAATAGANAAPLSERQQVALALRMSQKGGAAGEAPVIAAADDGEKDERNSRKGSGGHMSDRKRARENRASAVAAAATSKGSTVDGDGDGDGDDSSSSSDGGSGGGGSGGPKRASLLPRAKPVLESSVSGSNQRRSSPSLASPAGSDTTAAANSITDGGNKAFSTLGLASGVNKYATSKLSLDDGSLANEESPAKRTRDTGLSSTSSRLGARFQADVPPTTEANAAAAARAAAAAEPTAATTATSTDVASSTTTVAAAPMLTEGTPLSTAAVSVVGASTVKAEVSTAVPVAVIASDQAVTGAEAGNALAAAAAEGNASALMELDGNAAAAAAAVASSSAEPPSTTMMTSAAMTVVESAVVHDVDESAAWLDPLTAEECAAAEASGSESWYGWARDEKPLALCGEEPPMDGLVLSSGGAISDEKANAGGGGAVVVSTTEAAAATAAISSGAPGVETTPPTAPVLASDSMELDSSSGSSGGDSSGTGLENASTIAPTRLALGLVPMPVLVASRSAPLPLSSEGTADGQLVSAPTGASGDAAGDASSSSFKAVVPAISEALLSKQSTPSSLVASAAAAEEDTSIDCLGWTDEEQAAFAVLVTVHLKDFRAVSRNMPPRPRHSLPPPPFAARCNFVDDDDDDYNDAYFNGTAGMRARAGSSGGASSSSGGGRQGRFAREAPRSGSMDVSTSSNSSSSGEKRTSAKSKSSSSGASSSNSGPKRAYGFKPIERVEEAADGGEDVVLEEYRSGAECATKLGLTANEVSDAVRGKTLRAQGHKLRFKFAEHREAAQKPTPRSHPKKTSTPSSGSSSTTSVRAASVALMEPPPPLPLSSAHFGPSMVSAPRKQPPALPANQAFAAAAAAGAAAAAAEAAAAAAEASASTSLPSSSSSSVAGAAGAAGAEAQLANPDASDAAADAVSSPAQEVQGAKSRRPEVDESADGADVNGAESQQRKEQRQQARDGDDEGDGASLRMNDNDKDGNLVGTWQERQEEDEEQTGDGNKAGGADHDDESRRGREANDNDMDTSRDAGNEDEEEAGDDDALYDENDNLISRKNERGEADDNDDGWNEDSKDADEHEQEGAHKDNAEDDAAGEGEEGGRGEVEGENDEENKDAVAQEASSSSKSTTKAEEKTNNGDGGDGDSSQKKAPPPHKATAGSSSSEMDHTGSGNDDAASSTSFLMSKPKRAAAAGDKVYTPAAAAEKEQQALQLEEGGGDDGMAWKKLDKLSDWASPGTRVRHSKSGCVGVVVGVNVAWTSVLFDTDPGKAMSGSGMQRSCRVGMLEPVNPSAQLVRTALPPRPELPVRRTHVRAAAALALADPRYEPRYGSRDRSGYGAGLGRSSSTGRSTTGLGGYGDSGGGGVGGGRLVRSNSGSSTRSYGSGDYWGSNHHSSSSGDVYNRRAGFRNEPPQFLLPSGEMVTSAQPPPEMTMHAAQVPLRTGQGRTRAECVEYYYRVFKRAAKRDFFRAEAAAASAKATALEAKKLKEAGEAKKTAQCNEGAEEKTAEQMVNVNAPMVVGDEAASATVPPLVLSMEEDVDAAKALAQEAATTVDAPSVADASNACSPPPPPPSIRGAALTADVAPSWQEAPPLLSGRSSGVCGGAYGILKRRVGLNRNQEGGPTAPPCECSGCGLSGDEPVSSRTNASSGGGGGGRGSSIYGGSGGRGSSGGRSGSSSSSNSGGGRRGGGVTAPSSTAVGGGVLGRGLLLCCNRCPRAFHPACCSPPLPPPLALMAVTAAATGSFTCAKCIESDRSLFVDHRMNQSSGSTNFNTKKPASSDSAEAPYEPATSSSDSLSAAAPPAVAADDGASTHLGSTTSAFAELHQAGASELNTSGSSSSSWRHPGSSSPNMTTAAATAAAASSNETAASGKHGRRSPGGNSSRPSKASKHAAGTTAATSGSPGRGKGGATAAALAASEVGAAQYRAALVGSGSSSGGGSLAAKLSSLAGRAVSPGGRPSSRGNLNNNSTSSHAGTATTGRGVGGLLGVSSAPQGGWRAAVEVTLPPGYGVLSPVAKGAAEETSLGSSSPSSGAVTGAGAGGEVRALDGGVHATAEAAAEARDLLALRVGAADPLGGYGVRALNFPARLGAYLQRLPPDVATRVAAAAAAQTYPSGCSGSSSNSGPSPFPAIPWRPSSTSPQPLLQNQARLSPRPPGQQPTSGRSVGSPGGSADHAGPSAGSGPSAAGAGGPVPIGSGGNAAVQLVRQLQQLQQLQLLHQQQNQQTRGDAEAHPSSDKAQQQQQQQQHHLQQQQLQQHQQQLQMMFSPARMSQVLAAMQAQAAGTANASSSPAAAGLAPAPSPAVAPPLPCDELSVLLPGATSFDAMHVREAASGSTQENRSSTNDGKGGSLIAPTDALGSSTLPQLPSHDEDTTSGPQGSSLMAYAQNAPGVLAAPHGTVRAALPFGGSRSNSENQEGGQLADLSGGGAGTTSTTGKRETGASDSWSSDGGRAEDASEVKRPRV